MIIKGLVEEDFVNYKKPSMVVMFPRCSFKCDKECGQRVCHNSILANASDIEIDADTVVERFLNNRITQTMVFGGLEPFDSYDDMIYLIERLRAKGFAKEIIVYSGYTEEELRLKGILSALQKNSPIIIKTGRFIPDRPSRYDDILGINLASDNQYSIIIN